jgi:hypothetical protein
MDNILYLSSSNGQNGIAADTTPTAYPFIPAMRTGVSYQDTLDSFSVRIGASVQPNYTFLNNVIVGGAIGDTEQSQVDLSSATLQQTYFPQYSSLGSSQSFPSGDTRAAREANVGWVDPANLNFSLTPGGSYAGRATDGGDIGTNIAGLTAAQGTISNVTVANFNGGVTVTFTTPDTGKSCWVAYGPRSAPLSTYTLSNADTSQTQQRTIVLNGVDTVLGPHRGPTRTSTAIAVMCNGTVPQVY